MAVNGAHWASDKVADDARRVECPTRLDAGWFAGRARVGPGGWPDSVAAS